MSIEQQYDDREVRTSDLVDMVEHLKVHALRVYMNKSRAFSDLVTDMMVEMFPGTPSTRADVEQAVRHLVRSQ